MAKTYPAASRFGGSHCRDRLRPCLLRGGSFINNRRNVRCAYRNNNHPDNFNDNRGFRVVAHGFPASVEFAASILRRLRLAQQG